MTLIKVKVPAIDTGNEVQRYGYNYTLLNFLVLAIGRGHHKVIV
jgi:DNA-directed RNA polymerase subunit L